MRTREDRCTAEGSFVAITFDSATLVRSNLGGQGGRCQTPDICEEVTSTDTPHEIYIRNIGRDEIEPQHGLGTGVSIDLVITNMSEYYAWNANWNGIKEKVEDTPGSFGVINLLGPRDPSQTGHIWNSQLTIVQLKYDFVTGSQRLPVKLARTYMSFYDFDTGVARFDGSATQSEAMQIDPQAVQFTLTSESELVQYEAWPVEHGGFVNSSALIKWYQSWTGESVENVTEVVNGVSERLGSWATPIMVASAYGVGQDNPFDTYSLTQQQAHRSIMVRFENVSSFEVRFAISECCTTGRNFLFAGYSNIELPICNQPPVRPPTSPPPVPTAPPPSHPPPARPLPPSPPTPSSPSVL